MDEHYPTIDVKFIKEMIMGSGKVIDTLTVGSTTAYIIEGSRFIGKRTINIRGNDTDQIGYMYATGVAIKLNCIGPLLTWLEENRSWKEGAYITK